jgi:thiol-disulfide isomerase/thioredoxin
MRKSLSVLMGAVCALVLTTACSKAADEPEEGLEVGNKFLHYDTFSTTTIDGKEIELTDYKGKLLFIDFWSSWCAPCKTELPYIKVVHETYGGDEFAVLGISLDNSLDDLRDMANDYGVTYPQICDRKGWQSQYAAMFNIRSIPTNFLLDGSGVIIAKNLRGLALQGRVAKALGRDDPAIHYTEAMDYLQQTKEPDFEKALELVDKAIEADPERPEYRFLAAALHMGAQNNEKAIEHYKIGLNHKDALPGFASAMMAYARLSHLYKMSGQTGKAIEVLDEAIAAINALPDDEKRTFERAIPQIERLKTEWSTEGQQEQEDA